MTSMTRGIRLLAWAVAGAFALATGALVAGVALIARRRGHFGDGVVRSQPAYRHPAAVRD